MKQPKIHIQDENLVNCKAHYVCGHSVNGHFQIIVAYKSSDPKKQYFNNTNWMIRNKFKNTASIATGIPAVPFNRKVTVDGTVVRQQQMSLPEAVEIVHRYCKASGVFADLWDRQNGARLYPAGAAMCNERPLPGGA